MNPVSYENFIGKVDCDSGGRKACREAMAGSAGRKAAGGMLALAAVLLAGRLGFGEKGRRKEEKSGTDGF